MKQEELKIYKLPFKDSFDMGRIYDANGHFIFEFNSNTMSEEVQKNILDIILSNICT